MFENDPRPNRDESIEAICAIGLAAQEARTAGDGSLDPLVVPLAACVESAHQLAMICIQTNRYSKDPDFKESVDRVLTWTADWKRHNDRI